MTTTLNELVDKYLADTDFHSARNQVTAKRDEHIGALQAVTKSFINKELDN